MHLTGNKIANERTKFFRTSPQHNSKTVTNELKNVRFHKEIPKENYVSSERRQKIIDDLRLI